MTGEELYNEIANYMGVYGPPPLLPWTNQTIEIQDAFNHVAASLVRATTPIPRPAPFPSTMFPGALIGAMPIPHDTAPIPNYALLLRKYGRHAPNCPTSAPCTCGFSEIEKEWNPAA